MRFDYSYFEDGRLKTLKDLDDQTGDPHYVQFHYMSRAFSYGPTGRIAGVYPNSDSGAPGISPFTGSYTYDAFGNLTVRSGRYAINPDEYDYASYTNNRRVQTGWSYDADGRLSMSADSSDSGGNSTRQWIYDAAGQLVTANEWRGPFLTTNNREYDGDGELMYESVGSLSNYLIPSTVLGAVLTKLTAQGNKDTTYVPTNGLTVALQNQNPGGTPAVGYVHQDALGLQEGGGSSGFAYDPFGSRVNNVQPPVGQGPPPYVPFYGATWGGLSWSNFINANNLSAGCQWNGRAALCSDVRRNLENGLGELGGSFDPWTETSGPVFPGGLLVKKVDRGNDGVFYEDASFASELAFDPDPTQQHHSIYNTDACYEMATQAQHFADQALKKYGGDLKKALGEFDYNFSVLYAGRPLNSIRNALILMHGADVKRAGEQGLLGESGFKQTFQEGNRWNDQTHHFVTYFSGGLNQAHITTSVHQYLVEDNDADKRLGEAAFDLGVNIEKRPEDLRRIRFLIDQTVCEQFDRERDFTGIGR
jgi:YD repeat-containing protein